MRHLAIQFARFGCAPQWDRPGTPSRNVNTKVCTDCHECKSEREFYATSVKPNGRKWFTNRCKACTIKRVIAKRRAA